MILVQVEDFIGQYKLAQSQGDDVVIQSYIDREEKKTLYKLLGKTLADLLIAYIASDKEELTVGPLVVGQYYEITDFNTGDDFTNVGASSNETGIKFTATGTTPTVWTNSSVLEEQTKRFEDILNPFYLESGNTPCKHYESNGIKDLLLIQIYYAYLSENQLIHSQSGVVSQTAENNTVQSPAQAFRMGEQKWNAGGLDTWYAIRWFCKCQYPDVYPDYNGIREDARYSSLM